ncbi:MAG: dihydroorotate dehydrogenase electron transfer subunit [Nannocystaceae bacterium]
MPISVDASSDPAYETPVSVSQFRACLRVNERLGAGYFRQEFEADEPADFGGVRPGQFVMLRGEWGRDLINGRAFSVLSVDGTRRFSILGKVLGRGTARMHAASEGAQFVCTGPLGHGFPAARPGVTQLLVAGGVGLPPLLFQAERAVEHGVSDGVELFYGGRCRDDLVLLQRLAATGALLQLATDDGTEGHHGRVVAPLEARLRTAKAHERIEILACGPTPMLRAVRAIGLAARLPTFLALEEQMACGFGVCLGCAVPVRGEKPYKYCCTDGPVFDAREVRWS